ncbi:MAG: M14 family zinc carboxypeptidase [Ilumatobacter sp.]
MPRVSAGLATLVLTLAAACSSNDGSDAVVIDDPSTTSPATVADRGSPGVFSENDPIEVAVDDAVTSSTTATQTTTAAPTSSTVTTTVTTTVAPTTVVAANPDGSFDLTAELLFLGTSVEGRGIVAERYGSIGGRRVLVIGVIHGNEDAGVQIVDELRSRAVAGQGPDGVEMWLVETMNPDGQAVQDRHNANEVDLNRNFPLRWGPIGQPGDGQYAGTGPASEPETQAMVSFISQLRPDIAVWYHQDANLIIPSSGRDGRIRAKYAELTGLPIADCCDGGIYTGIAATWARDELSDLGSVAFIVELPGGELDATQVTTHADAISIIAATAGVI